MNETLYSLQGVQTIVRRDRARGLALLNELFRSGEPPAPLMNGRYAGKLVALDIAPVVTTLFNALTAVWLPWKGKTFNASRQQGDNVFTRDSLLIARLFNPLYRGFVDDSPHTYRAFRFRTYVAAGREDPDRQVLKIDYNLPESPSLTIRRVLDELVQVEPGVFLGKAHVQWWWGRWQRVAFFALSRKMET